jgi:hypothetical protein
MATQKFVAVAKLTGRNPKTKERYSIAAGEEYTPNDTAERDRLLAGGYIRRAKDVAADSAAAKAAEEEARKNTGA